MHTQSDGTTGQKLSIMLRGSVLSPSWEDRCGLSSLGSMEDNGLPFHCLVSLCPQPVAVQILGHPEVSGQSVAGQLGWNPMTRKDIFGIMWS